MNDPTSLMIERVSPIFVVVGNKVETLTIDSEGIYRDELGTVWAEQDSGSSADNKIRCGVGWFSLPEDDPRNAYCATHDFAYNSRAFQAYHTRKFADLALALQLHNGGFPVSEEVFYEIVRTLGWEFWENERTNV